MEKKKRTIIITVAAVVALCGGGYAYAYNVQNKDLATCTQKVVDLKAARHDYNAAVKGESVQTALKIKTDEVKDAKTVRALKDETGIRFSTPTCPAKISYNVINGNKAINKATKAADDAMASYASATKALPAKALAVNTSKAAKALDTDITSASKTLSDSNGKVQDGKTRDALTTEISRAKLTDSNVKATLKQLNDAKATLDQKVKAVNDSVNAKSAADKAKADADAAAKAAAAQSAAASASTGSASTSTTSGSGYSGYSGSGYSGSGYSGGSSTYRSGGYSGGSTYHAPAAPKAPSKPASGGNGGGGAGSFNSNGQICTTGDLGGGRSFTDCG